MRLLFDTAKLCNVYLIPNKFTFFCSIELQKILPRQMQHLECVDHAPHNEKNIYLRTGLLADNGLNDCWREAMPTWVFDSNER